MSAAAKFGTVIASSLDVRQSLDAVLKAARESHAEDLPDLIGKLEAIKAIAWARLTVPTPAPAHDELIAVTEAAHRLGISENYLYTHHREYPFTRRQGRKLLFSAAGIERYIQQNRA